MTETNTTELAAVKAADIAAQPLSIKDAVLAQFKEAETTLVGLAEKYRAVAYDVTTTKGMAEAKAARADLRDNGRLFVTKAETRIKGEVNDLKRVMAAEVERLVGIVKPHEDAIDAQIKAEEQRKADEKAERERLAAERVAQFQAKLDKIASYPRLLEGRSLEAMEGAIATVEGITIGEDWAEFADRARDAMAKALTEMRAVADRERQRIENERRAAELQAQQEKLERERMEFMRQRVAASVFTFPEPEPETAQEPELTADVVAEAVCSPAAQETAPAEPAAAAQTEELPAEDTSPVVTTGVVCDRLGLTLRAEFIQALGFEPVPCPGRGTYWKESDIKQIGLAIIKHIEGRIQ